MTRTREVLRFWFDALFWPLLFVFIVLSLAIAMQWFFSLELDRSFFEILDYADLATAIAVQGLVLAVVILAWQYNLRLHGLKEITFRQSLTMVGINAVGKYTPGKVWGILARGTALLKISGDKRVVVQATLVEQLALFHSGAAVSLIAFLFGKTQVGFAIAMIVLSMLSVIIVARFGHLVAYLRAKLLKRNVESEPITDAGFKQSYIFVWTLLTVVWILSAVVLRFCIAACHAEAEVPNSEILLITSMAYLGGFLAFFSIAGLGVREGLMVAMLSTHMEVETAVYVSILHRFATLLFDVLVGAAVLWSSDAALRESLRGSLYSYVSAPAPRYLLRIAILSRLFNKYLKGTDKAFLEIGPGRGDVACYLAQHPSFARGMIVDRSSDAAAFVRQRITEQSHVKVVSGDALTVVENETFDVIASFEILEHIENDEAFMISVHRMLQNDGLWFISVPAYMRKWQRQDQWAGHVRRYEEQEIRNKLSAAGFHVEKLRDYGFPLTSLMKPIRQYYYRKSDDQTQLDKTLKSGIDRPLFSGRKPWLMLILLSPFIVLQTWFSWLRMGDGFIVVARKQ